MDEYIRRQDAINVAQNYHCSHDITIIPNTEYSRGFYDGLTIRENDILQGLSELKPSADVAPVVHGRWIWKPTKQYCPPDCWYPPINHEETWNEKDGTWLEDEMYCSECNYHNFREVKFNFCPNCGAIMDAKEEE